MSRYTIVTKDGVLAYGWDPPLQEHFVQLLKTDEMIEQEYAAMGAVEDDEEVYVDPCIFWVGTRQVIKPANECYTNQYPAHEMAKILAHYGAPDDHVEAVRRGAKI